MVSAFIQYIKKHNLSDLEKPVLLSISGGIDSMVMADLYRNAGFPFGIVHFNFQLRGKESDQDETFVGKYARSLGVPYFQVWFNTLTYAKKNQLSIQMAARELRRTFSENLVRDHGFASYATAHHLDDHIETFFINVLHGTGISGLRGILPRQGMLIHPMLFAFREQIVQYARKNKIKFREDSSNREQNYERNKIRQGLMPLLEQIRPGFKQTLIKDMERVRQAEIFLEFQLKRIEPEIKQTRHGKTCFRIEILKNLPGCDYVLYELIRPYHFSYAQALQITEQLDAQAGAQYFSKSHRILRDRQWLILDELTGTDNSQSTIQENTSCIEFPIRMKIRRMPIDKSYVIPRNRYVAAIDADCLEYPMIIRRWKRGDYFYPFGSRGRKLLSDFFIDNKFRRDEKEKTWLLLSGNNIVWVIGHRLDDRYKITSQTSSIIEISVEETD